MPDRRPIAASCCVWTWVDSFLEHASVVRTFAWRMHRESRAGLLRLPLQTERRHSAQASSWRVAAGICPFPEAVSEKIGRTKKLEPGQIAGAAEPRFASSMPATNVPCLQAMLSLRAQVPCASRRLRGCSRWKVPDA
jgi:hypothetical protein